MTNLLASIPLYAFDNGLEDFKHYLIICLYQNIFSSVLLPLIYLSHILALLLILLSKHHYWYCSFKSGLKLTVFGQIQQIQAALKFQYLTAISLLFLI